MHLLWSILVFVVQGEDMLLICRPCFYSSAVLQSFYRSISYSQSSVECVHSVTIPWSVMLTFCVSMLCPAFFSPFIIVLFLASCLELLCGTKFLNCMIWHTWHTDCTPASPRRVAGCCWWHFYIYQVCFIACLSPFRVLFGGLGLHWLFVLGRCISLLSQLFNSWWLFIALPNDCWTLNISNHILV